MPEEGIPGRGAPVRAGGETLVLLVDVRAGLAALHGASGEVARLAAPAGDGPVPAEPDAPAGLPWGAALRLADTCVRDGAHLLGALANDPRIRFLPGLEHLPFRRGEFSLSGGDRGRAAAVAARDAFERAVQAPGRPLRVLHLFHGDGGGPFELLLSVAPHLHAAGIESACVALKEPDVAHDLPECLASRFLRPEELGAGEPSFDGFVNLRRYEEAALDACARLHRARPFDLVHVHAHAALAARAFHALLGLPVVVTQHVVEREMERHTGRLEEDYAYHTPELREQIRDVFRREAQVAALASFVVGPSRAACAEIARRLAVPQERIVHIPNGIDPPARGPTPLAVHLARGKAGRRIVSFVGALTRVKGADRFFAAASRILEARPEVEAFVAGAAWAGHDDLAGWLAAAGGARDRIRLLGRVTRGEARDLLAVSDLVLCPSRYETFGLVALEAMAAGCVPVVSDVGGLPELVGGSGAGVVVGGEAPEFAAAALDLLARDLAPLRARGKERAAAHPARRTAAMLAALYGRACAEGRP